MHLSKITSKSLGFLKTKYKEGGIIQSAKTEFTDVAKNSDLYVFKEISGSNVEEVNEQLKSMLKQITAIYRDELTVVEHLWFQIIAPEQLLFVDYKQIKTVFDEHCAPHQLWTNEGVVLHKHCSNEISLSLFYFQGVIDITSNEKLHWDLADLDIPSFLIPTED